MEKTNSNDPINPSPEWVSTENREHGLTKREYFAGLAMQSLLAHYLSENVTEWDMKTYAVESVALDDAIIAELNSAEVKCVVNVQNNIK